MEIAYKVVRVKKSERFKKTIYTSCIDNDYSVEYKVGEITKPVIGKLFVFSKMPEWEQGNYVCRRGKVFKCLVDSLEITDEIVFHPFDSTMIKDFWTDGLSYDCLKDPPRDTCFCNECMLLEDVTKQMK